MSRERFAVRFARFSLRGLVCLLSGIAILAGYSWASHHAIGPATLLPLTPIDRAIPLIPATVWVYHSLVAFIAVAWFWVPSVRLARRLLLSLVVTTVACMVVFVVFPTARYPVAITSGDSVSRWALELLWQIDDPTNCLPSLHVALATCVALTLREYGRSRVWRIVPIYWAVAIAIATLTTKQHYAVDVVAGAAVGWLAHAVVAWAARSDRRPYWTLGTAPIRLDDPREQLHLDRLQAAMKARAWRVDDLPALAAATPRPLPPDMIRFLNQVIYVEHIAAINFDFLARAAKEDPKLRAIYLQFAADERRHADGLRRLLVENGADVHPPGLGCAMLLAQFDALDPECDADAMLVAMGIPVFETFLDAGTIPFVRRHPAIASPGLDALIANICRDESRHLAVNWAVSRAAVRSVQKTRFGGLRMFLNPVVIRSALATPFLAIDVYAHARRLGFRFVDLVPSFRRLAKLHHGYPELKRFPIWFGFRIWVAIAALVTWTVIAIDRVAPRALAWLARVVPAMTDRICRLWFDDALLARRGLPRAGEQTPGGEPCREAA